MDKHIIAIEFLKFTHGRNFAKCSDRDIARIAEYLAWSEDELIMDANRNIEAWQARLFARGVAVGMENRCASP